MALEVQMSQREETLLAQLVEALAVLRDLHDLQNGPPLPKYEVEWWEVMTRASKLLKKGEAMSEDKCTWTYFGDSPAWDTGCGRAFELNDGAPLESDMRYCCFCGRLLREVETSDGRAADNGVSDV